MTEPKPEYKVPQPKRGRGRPSNGDFPKKLRIRVSTKQLEHLEQSAQAAGLSIAAYIRRLIDTDRAI